MPFAGHVRTSRTTDSVSGSGGGGDVHGRSRGWLDLTGGVIVGHALLSTHAMGHHVRWHVRHENASNVGKKT